MDNYEKVLPAGYTCVRHLDARDKKTGILLTIASLVITALLYIPYLLLCRWSDFSMDHYISVYTGFIIGLIFYIVLHELVHGAAYKLLTHEKLTFGFSWSCAFCGVPDIYTYRKTALIALLSPFTVFTIILFPVTILLHSSDVLAYLACAFIFCMHIGGCIGDLYVTYLFVFKYKDSRTLMMDKGPDQFFYLPADKGTAKVK